MNELDLLVENYFTDSFETSDLFRLVEQVMLQEAFNIPIKNDDDVDNFSTRQDKGELKKLLAYLATLRTVDVPIVGGGAGKFKIRNQKDNEKTIRTWIQTNTPSLTAYAFGQGSIGATDKISNRGDVVEGLLGVALFISLRGEIPTKQRIVDTLALLNSQSDQSGSLKKISKSLEDTGINDTPITLKIALNRINFEDLVSDQKRYLLEKEYANVLRYSRSNYFKNFMSTTVFDRANPPQSNVTISVMGALEQTTSKADLNIFKDNELVFAQSLKYGSRQLGQVGGKDPEKVFGFITKIFGADLPPQLQDAYRKILPNPTKEQFYRISSALFAQVYSYATQRLQSDPDYEKKLLMVLRNSALGDESNIDLLNFEKNKFRLLDFESIIELVDHLNLHIDFQATPENLPKQGGYPILTVYDPRQSIVPNKASTLFTVRPKYEVSGPVLRFYVEYGNLIDHALSKVNENKLKD